MTFAPAVDYGVADEARVPRRGPRARRALARDAAWCEIARAKAAAAPRSDAKARAVAAGARGSRRSTKSAPDVAAAREAKAVARRAWLERRAAHGFDVTLEPGSALFFNMALNARWTHAIEPEAARTADAGRGDSDDSDDDAAGDDGDHGDEGGAAPTGTRVSVTLRATRTVFDPARQAMAEGRCRAWRKQIWQPIDEMAPWDLASEADSDSGG